MYPPASNSDVAVICVFLTLCGAALVVMTILGSLDDEKWEKIKREKWLKEYEEAKQKEGAAKKV